MHSPNGGTENMPSCPGLLAKGASPSGVLKVKSFTSWVSSLMPVTTTMFGTSEDPSQIPAHPCSTTISGMVFSLLCGLCIYTVDNRGDVHGCGAVDQAAPAAHAERFSVSFFEEAQLVHEALPYAISLLLAGIVIACHERVVLEHAAIPAAESGVFLLFSRLTEIEAVASWAYECAATTGETGCRDLIPQRAIEHSMELFGYTFHADFGSAFNGLTINFSFFKERLPDICKRLTAFGLDANLKGIVAFEKQDIGFRSGVWALTH